MLAPEQGAGVAGENSHNIHKYIPFGKFSFHQQLEIPFHQKDLLQFKYHKILQGIIKAYLNISA